MNEKDLNTYWVIRSPEGTPLAMIVLPEHGDVVQLIGDEQQPEEEQLTLF